MNYLIELKQLVKFPRCRIYRGFMTDLMKNKKIRTSRTSYLFFYIILCSFASYANSRRVVGRTAHVLEAGEGVCSLQDLTTWFRFKVQRSALDALQVLQDHHLISFLVTGGGTQVKYKITEWEQMNKIVHTRYEAPCRKDRGFFFISIKRVEEVLRLGRCSEMDIFLDMWVHAVYKDPQVVGSDLGPVIYFRNGTGQPLLNYAGLAVRWGIAKSSVSRYLRALEAKGLLQHMSFPGQHGTVIYLSTYLTTMFAVSDSMVDKEEVATTFNITITIKADVPVDEPKIIVPAALGSVPEEHLRAITRSAVKALDAQGIPCAKCREAMYILSLSDCGGDVLLLEVDCGLCGICYDYQLKLLSSPAPLEGGAFK